MRTRPQLIPWILTFAITGAAVVLRFVQLLLFTDSSTGRVTAAGAPLSYGLYALLLCAGVCCTVCALHQSHTAVAVAANGGSRRLTVVSYLVSVAFFFDFIYRCFLCYDLADGAVYLQWNDLVSEGLTALFALLSCSYYFVVGRSYGGGRYDFRAFRFFSLPSSHARPTATALSNTSFFTRSNTSSMLQSSLNQLTGFRISMIPIWMV